MSGWRYSPEQVIAAIEQAQGNVSAAARVLGCSRPTIRRYVARYAAVREAYERECEAHRRHYSPEQMADAIEQARGNKRAAARAVGCTELTMHRYIARYAPVREAYERGLEAYRQAYEAHVAGGGRDMAPPGPERRPWFDPLLIAEAVREARGILSVAARAVPCSKRTITNYMERYPVVREAYEDARANLVDLVQVRLAEAVAAGNLQAITTVLTQLGADRGYTRKRARGAGMGPDAEAVAEFEAAVKREVARRRREEGPPSIPPAAAGGRAE